MVKNENVGKGMLRKYDKIKFIEKVLHMLDEKDINQLFEDIEQRYYCYPLEGELPPFDSAEFRFKEYMAKNNGNVFRRDMKKMNITPYMFKKFIKEYNLIEVSDGVYVSPKSEIDGEFLFQGQYKTSVVSHETALYYHELSDVIPSYIKMSMPNQYKLSQLLTDKNMNGNYRSICKEHILDSEEVVVRYRENVPIILVTQNNIPDAQQVEYTNRLGNTIRLTSVERTLVDSLKLATKLEEEVKVSALTRYANSERKNMTRLRRIAQQQGILKLLDYYLVKHSLY